MASVCRDARSAAKARGDGGSAMACAATVAGHKLPGVPHRVACSMLDPNWDVIFELVWLSKTGIGSSSSRISSRSRVTMHDPLTAIASGDTYTTVGPAHDEEGLH